ncbi:MAG TPA: bacterial transcriptional activator domain-containing protein [Anaerolineales bacterium]|nr:bacterial transcriptional activator domain-containing protein [Anaerolineales bacterium]
MGDEKPVADLIAESLALERATADMGAALKIARQAQALADAQGSPAEQAAARVAVARFRFRMGQYAAAQELAEQALAITTPFADETAAVHIDALLMLGMCTSENGEMAATEQYYRQAADLAREIAHPLFRLRALHNLATGVYGPRGQFDLAQASDEEACQVARQHGLHEWLYFPLITLAWNFQTSGQTQRARNVLEELQRVSSPEAGGMAYYELYSAQVDMDEGCLDTYLDHLGRARTIAERTGDPGLNVEFRLGLSRGYRLAGQLAQARAWVEDALAFIGRVGYPSKQAEALVERGRLAWLQGDCAAAEADWWQAEHLFLPSNAAYELAEIALLRAAMLHQQELPDAPRAWLDCTRQVRERGYYFLLQRERSLAYPLIAAYLNSPDPALSEASAALLPHLQDAPPPPLRIHLLGQMQAWQGKRPIPRQELRLRRAGELLGLLLTTPGGMLTFDQVSEALCSDKDLDAAQHFYHHATSALRRALEPDLPDKRFPSRYLEVDEGCVRLRLPPGSWIDNAVFEEHCLRKEWQAAADLYRGDFLPEFRYADWAAAYRERLSERYHEALLALAQARLDAGDFSAALELARRLMARDPWHEGAAGAAMRACLGLNDRSAARRVYKRLEKTLADELGVEPPAELQALYRACK